MCQLWLKMSLVVTVLLVAGCTIETTTQTSEYPVYNVGYAGYGAYSNYSTYVPYYWGPRTYYAPYGTRYGYGSVSSYTYRR